MTSYAAHEQSGGGEPYDSSRRLTGAAALWAEVETGMNGGISEAVRPMTQNARVFLGDVIAPELFPEDAGSQRLARFLVREVVLPAYVRARTERAGPVTEARITNRMRELWLHIEGRGDKYISDEPFAATRSAIRTNRNQLKTTLAEHGYDQTYFQAVINRLITTKKYPQPDKAIETVLDFVPAVYAPKPRPERPVSYRQKRAALAELVPKDAAHPYARRLLKELFGKANITDDMRLTHKEVIDVFDNLLFPVFAATRKTNRNGNYADIPVRIEEIRLYLSGNGRRKIAHELHLNPSTVYDHIESFVNAFRIAGYTPDFLREVLAEKYKTGTWPTEIPLLSASTPARRHRPARAAARRSVNNAAPAPGNRANDVRAMPRQAVRQEKIEPASGQTEESATKIIVPVCDHEEMGVTDLAHAHGHSRLTVRRIIEQIEADAPLKKRLALCADGRVDVHFRDESLTRIMRHLERVESEQRQRESG